MKLYAVSHIDWFDHDLVTEFHQANSAREALVKHSKVATFDLSEMPQSLEEIKTYFFDMDCMVESVEVPTNP